MRGPGTISPASSGAEPVPGLRAWFAIAILLMLTILSYIDRSIIALLVGPIEADLHIDDFQVSLLQGFAFAMFYAIANIPMGWVSDRFSRRLVVFLGATVWSLATAACGFASSFAQLFTARVAVGMGEASLSPAAYALTADLFPPRRLTFAIGIITTGAAIGSALALVVGGIVVAWANSVPPIAGLRSWQLVFVVVGLPGLMIAPLIFLVTNVRHTVAAQADALAPAPHYGRWLMSRLRYFVPLSVGAGFAAIVAFAVAAWTPAYMQRHFGYDIKTIGITIGIAQGVGGIIGFGGGGWLVDRLGAMGMRNPHSAYLIASTGLSTVVAGIAFSLVSSVPLLLFMLVILHILMPFTAPALTQAQLITPRIYRARTVALFFLVFNLMGMIIGPSSVALLTEYVLGGPAHVGAGIALSVCIFGPLGTICMIMAGRAAGPMLAEAGVY